VKHRDGQQAKCAVCQAEFHLKVEDLKPLYGIREAIEKLNLAYANARKDEGFDSISFDFSVWSKCSIHEGEKADLWCCSCSKEICKSCQESDHKKHVVKSFKAELKHRAGNTLENLSSTSRQWSERNLNMSIDACYTELDRLRELLGRKISKLEAEKDVLKQFENMKQKLQKLTSDKNDHEETNLDAALLELLKEDRIQNLRKTIDKYNIFKFSGLAKFSSLMTGIKQIKSSKHGPAATESDEAKFSAQMTSNKQMKSSKHGPAAAIESDEYFDQNRQLACTVYAKCVDAGPYPVLALSCSVRSTEKGNEHAQWRLLGLRFSLEGIKSRKQIVKSFSNAVYASSGQVVGSVDFIPWSMLVDPKNEWIHKDGKIKVTVEFFAFQLY